MELVLSGDNQAVEKGINVLKGAFWCNNSCYDVIIDAYLVEKDNARRSILANVYRELTGLNFDNIIMNIIQG